MVTCFVRKNSVTVFYGVLAANALDFVVGHHTAFEVPLNNVSHSTIGKNEVTLEFHQNDDAAVSLMEMRFHIPSGDGEVDPVNVCILL